MAGLPIELFLALRYLRPRRTFVSVITLISVIGVMLGVAVLIIVLSVMSGFDREMRDRILGFNAHLKVTEPDRRPMPGFPELMNEIKKHPEVLGTAPYIESQVLVKTQPLYGPQSVLAPVIKGIHPVLETDVSDIPESIELGEFDIDDRGVLVGSILAGRMGLNVGDYLSIYSVSQIQQMESAVSRGNGVAILPDDFQIRGIFDVGYYEYDAIYLFCSLDDAQEFFEFDEDDLVHGLTIMLKDPEEAASVRFELLAQLDRDVAITTWMEESGDILNALIVEKNVMFYLLFFIMIVAAFGITSALITFSVQKTREIGMLKALGANNLQIIWIFLSQSLTVGVLGVSCGLLLGLTCLHYRNEFLYLMRRVTGFELFPASIYNFTQLPALIIPEDLALICGGSLAICLIAGVIPAWNASRLQPVEALRHE